MRNYLVSQNLFSREGKRAASTAALSVHRLAELDDENVSITKMDYREGG